MLLDFAEPPLLCASNRGEREWREKIGSEEVCGERV